MHTFVVLIVDALVGRPEFGRWGSAKGRGGEEIFAVEINSRWLD